MCRASPSTAQEYSLPRYHFHVSDVLSGRDVDGCDLPNVNAAHTMALKYAGEIIGDSTAAFPDLDCWSMRVTDSSDVTLFKLSFAATMP